MNLKVVKFHWNSSKINVIIIRVKMKALNDVVPNDKQFFNFNRSFSLNGEHIHS